MSLKLLPKLVRAGEGKRQTVLGDEEFIKLRGSDTAGQFMLIEQNSLPGVGIPMHVHTNEDEVFTVVSGKLRVNIGQEEHILNAGDTVFCPRGIAHSWEVVGKSRAKVLLANFPAGLEVMLEQLAELGGTADERSIHEICAKYGIVFTD